jgi:hypothetical protein
MESRLPLSALLSQPLVAFIIEFDNEFEHRVPHRTSDFGSTPGARHAPWLVSMAIWSQFLRSVPEDGIPVRELQRLIGLDNKAMKFWLTRTGEWWQYIFLDENAIVHPTPGGRKALTEWRPLTGLIEGRWRERFGDETVGKLCETLGVVARCLGAELPGSLPILGYGLFSNKPSLSGPSDPWLPSFLSKVLLAFAIEFERAAEVSLAISANVLRLVGDDGIRIRDLPQLAGVSKEAIAMSTGFLEKHGLAKTESSSRTKMLTLTQEGRDARARYHNMVRQIEAAWLERVPDGGLVRLRDLLEGMTGEPLFRGLKPYPDGWRASVASPTVLPHYPMLLHRGGFPDGS